MWSQQHDAQKPKGGATQGPLTDEWINTVWPSSLKRGEALTLATLWMDLENTMLRDRSQTPKAKHCQNPRIGRPYRNQTELDSRWPRAGEGGKGVINKRCRTASEGDENVPKSTVVMVQVPVNTLKTSELHTLNGYIVWHANYIPIKIFFF